MRAEFWSGFPTVENESNSSGTKYTYKYKKYSSWNAGAQIGYEHFLNSAIGLQYYLGYSFSHYQTISEYDYPTGTDYTYDSQLAAQRPSAASHARILGRGICLRGKSNSNGISFGVGLQIHLDWLNKKK